MEKLIYLDNSATTAPCEKAIAAINNALTKNWGNPSSLHMLGVNAEMEINNTRRAVAKSIAAKDDEIFFTSGGTESNNMAIYGAVTARRKRGNKIVTTAIEHPSVLETVKALEEASYEVIRLKPNKNGVISEEDIYAAIDRNTILVSIMLVNNETGAIQPLRAAADAIKAANAPALLHCDAVQAYGKIPINVNALGVDLLSVSGHKIHASKGVGFLYKRKGVNIAPLIHGGGQENGLRSGTENVPLICGLGGAVEDIGNIEKNLAAAKEIRDYAEKKLKDTGFITINSNEECLPYILNVSVNGYRSETVLHFLESKGIYVSSGSACSKGHKSYVLSEMGLDGKLIDSSLRLSFSRYTTKEEIDVLCEALTEAAAKLRKA